MKPVQLTLENFKSFRASQTIQFTFGHLRAIVGDTGAGKSSLLHAITYALYNTTHHSSLNLGELIAKGEKSASVAFTFDVQGQRWVVRRVLRKTGTVLHSLARDDGSEPFGTAQSVKEKIAELLGMNDDVFLKTVLLPQGRYQALLTAKDAERQDVLRKILDLQILPRMADIASFRSREAEQKIRKSEERASEFDELEKQVTETKAQLKALGVEIKSLGSTVERATKLRATIESRDTEIQARARKRQDLAAVSSLVSSLGKLDDERTEILSSVAHLEQERRNSENAIKQSDQKVAALVKAGSDRATLSAVQLELEKLLGALTEIARAEEILLKSGASRQALTIRALEERAKLRDRRKLLEEAIELRRETSRALDGAKTASSEIGRQNEALQGAILASTAACAELAVARSELLDAEETFKHASDSLGKALAVCAKAEARHRGAEHANHAATLARELHPGDSCPVCKSSIADGFKAPASADLTKAANELAAAVSARDQAAILERAASELLATLRTRTDSFAANANAKKSAQNEIRKALTSQGLDEKTISSKLTTLETESERLSRAIPQLEEDVKREQALYEKGISLVSSSRGELRSKRVEQRTLTHDLGDRRLKSAALSRTLPKRFAIKPLSVASVEARVAELNTLLLAADKVTKEREEANKSFGAAQQLLEKAREREAAVNEPWARHLERIALATRAVRESFRVESIDDARQADQLAQASISELDSEILNLNREQTKSSEEFSRLLEPTTAGTLADLQEILIQKRVAEGQSRTKIEQLTELQNKAASAKRNVEALVPIVAVSTTLRQLLHKDAFQQFVFEQRQRRLVEVGSEILGSMTGNRYGFTPDFEIDDRPYGARRPAVSLSGGEQFIASLALALAVVELAGAGGAKIEALFLDEGFDTLDSKSLDHVMTVVHERAYRGRSITVITHLSQVAQYVDETIVVEGSPQGSRIMFENDENAVDPSIQRMLSAIG